MSAGFAGIWLYAITKSILENIDDPLSCCAKSCICRVGYRSGIVRASSARWSPHSLQLSCFFLTRCMAEDQGLSDRLAVPSCIMSSNSFLAVLNRSTSNHRGWQLTGGPSVVLRCYVLCLGFTYVPAGCVTSGNWRSKSWNLLLPEAVFIQAMFSSTSWRGADTESQVNPSKWCWCLQSTSKL